MDDERAAAGLGGLGAAAVVALTLLPYAFAPAPAVGTYYAIGPAGPPLLATFAVIAALALAAGLRRRSDPALVAGVAVVLAGFLTLLGAWWALSVPGSFVGGLGTVGAAWQADLLTHHRWLLLGAAGLTLAGAGGYARAVL